jgi:hypothetical protein
MRDMINYDRQYVFHRQELPPPPPPGMGGGAGGQDMGRLPQKLQESANTSPNKGGGGAKRVESGPGSLCGVQAHRLGPWMGLIVFLGRHACTGTHARTV